MPTSKKKTRSRRGGAGYVQRVAARRPAQVDWQPITFLGGFLQRDDGRLLFVYVAPRRDDAWLALAVEGPGRGDPRAVLDDHGHRLIGEFATGEAAQRAAEHFARRWLVRRVPVEACACDEVSA